MMRLVRIAVAMLLLAALPAMTWAECGWVLWISTAGTKESGIVTQEGWPEATYNTLPECQEAARRGANFEPFIMGKKFARSSQAIPGGAVRYTVAGPGGLPVGDVYVVCLPAGTDPRPRSKE